MFYSYRPILGTIFIVIGAIMLIATIGELIFRVLTALFALALINVGLHLYQLPSIYIWANRWFFRRY